MVGARVHICADEEARDPRLLTQEMLSEGITVLEIVPALLRDILQPFPQRTSFPRIEPITIADFHWRKSCTGSLQ